MMLLVSKTLEFFFFFSGENRDFVVVVEKLESEDAISTIEYDVTCI